MIRTASGLADFADLFLGTDAVEAWIRTPDGLRQFFGSFSAFASPSAVSGVKNSAGSIPITTRSTTVSVSGAVGAITYAWTQVSGDPMTITNPSDAATAFSASAAPGDSLAAEFNCHISDEGGHSTDIPVSATINNLYGGTL